MSDKIIEFGAFRLENEAIYDGRNKQVELPDQAVKVLQVFLEHTLRQGQTVLSSEEIRHKAWLGRVVDKNNLHQQIIRLRKELGAGAIISTSGPRGYQFTLPVRVAGQPMGIPWRAISVLPFVCLPSFFRDEERLRLAGYYLALGIIDQLRRLTSLEVREISPECLQPGWQPNATQTARRQRADLVLTGHLVVANQGDELRAQLIQAETASVLWSGKFNAHTAGSAAVEQEIGQQIAATLGFNPPAGFATIRQPHPLAVASYRKGYYLWTTQYSLRNEALDEYTYALTLDPAYVDPWVGIAYIWMERCAFAPAIWAPNDGMPKVLAAALRALELDPYSSHAHASRALVAWLWEWNWELAEHHLRKAIEYGPDNVVAHHWLGRVLMYRDIDEAIRLAERAWELGPHLVFTGAVLAWVYYFAGQYAKAAALCRELIVQAPSFPVPYAVQAFVQEVQDELEEAAASSLAAIERGENLISLTTLGLVYGRMGRKAEAEQTLHELEARRKQCYVSPYNSAVIHCGLGNRREALHFLELAVTDRSEWLTHLPVDHRLRSLRDAEAYRAILKQVGL